MLGYAYMTSSKIFKLISVHNIINAKRAMPTGGCLWPLGKVKRCYLDYTPHPLSTIVEQRDILQAFHHGNRISRVAAVGHMTVIIIRSFFSRK